MMTIAETLEKQGEIIRLQSEIIDQLAVELLQHGTLAEEDLRAIKDAAIMQNQLLEDGGEGNGRDNFTRGAR